MNERIKELAESVGFTFIEDAVYGRRWYSSKCGMDADEFEKFAELIVNECADACYKHRDVESFGIYPIRVAMVTKACSNNIKEHFGIEE